MISSRCLSFKLTIFFVDFAVKVFQQTVGIPMGTNWAPLLADIFLYEYEPEFIQSFALNGKENIQHLGSISFTGTSMMYCP